MSRHTGRDSQDHTRLDPGAKYSNKTHTQAHNQFLVASNLSTHLSSNTKTTSMGEEQEENQRVYKGAFAFDRHGRARYDREFHKTRAPSFTERN